MAMLLARPPGAENHHDAKRAEDGEERTEEFVAFRDLAEEYVERGHLYCVLSPDLYHMAGLGAIVKVIANAI
jgi:hypothetical protein